MQTVGNRKNFFFFFSYFISENPNFSYMHFFRKCSMIHWNIPLKACQRSKIDLILAYDDTKA